MKAISFQAFPRIIGNCRKDKIDKIAVLGTQISNIYLKHLKKRLTIAWNFLHILFKVFIAAFLKWFGDRSNSKFGSKLALFSFDLFTMIEIIFFSLIWLLSRPNWKTDNQVAQHHHHESISNNHHKDHNS